MITAVETACPGKTKMFSNVSFSAGTATCRIREMSENVKCDQKDCFEICSSLNSDR